MFEKWFYENYRSVVVLANPKTVLNIKYAKKEVKEKVIRADQLVEFIRKIDTDPNASAASEKNVETLARFFLGIHKEASVDYTAKFRSEPKKEEKTDESMTNSTNSSKATVDPSMDAVYLSAARPAAAIHSPAVENSVDKDAPASLAAETPDTEYVNAENPEPVICPKCGAAMIRRKATKGANADKEFYGCSNYPHCRGLISIV